jgi:phosphoglucosamine mutase
MITALAVLARMVESGRRLSELRRVMRRYPQVLVNVRVRAKPEVESLAPVRAAVSAAEEMLGERGRVLVRYSGTEPLLRVMLEGEQEQEIRTLADDIASAIAAEIGA